MEEIRQEEYTVVVDESKASSLKRLTPERFLLGLLTFYQVITDQDYPDIKLILKNRIPSELEEYKPVLPKSFKEILDSLTIGKKVVKVLEVPNKPRANYIVSFAKRYQLNKEERWTECMEGLTGGQRDIIYRVVCRL